MAGTNNKAIEYVLAGHIAGIMDFMEILIKKETKIGHSKEELRALLPPEERVISAYQLLRKHEELRVMARDIKRNYDCICQLLELPPPCYAFQAEEH